MTIVNRIDPEHSDIITRRLTENSLTSGQLLFTIPNKPALGRPTIREVARALNADMLYSGGENELNRHVHSFRIGAMQIQNLLSSIGRGSLIITAGDRADILVACMAASASPSGVHLP